MDPSILAGRFLVSTANTANFCSSVYDKHDNPLTSEEEEQRAIAKIKMLGNIKFIGELGKLDLIHESILHKCIKTVRVLSCCESRAEK